MKRTTTALAGIAAFALAAPAFAQQTATVATDLNLRAGPGSNYQIEGVLPAEAQVEVSGCVESRTWCEVTYDGMTGYAFAPYLAVTETDTLVTVPEATVTTFETVEYSDENGDEALIGGALGAGIASAAIGGPAAIAAGAVIGSLTGAGIEPETTTVTYIQENPVDPIFIEGEPLIGASIPAEVELVAIPDTEYTYLNLNGQNVVVDPSDRTIVYIQR